jgi:hypothetical protein
MWINKRANSSWLLISAVAILLPWMAAGPLQAHGQNCPSGLTTCQGWNGVYLSSSTHSPSIAFVDAQPYVSDSRCAGGACNICDAIYFALQDYTSAYPGGLVIDGRGFASPQACVSGSSRHPNPWASITGSTPYSTVVLLPPGVIYIEQTWILPDFTQLIGEGSSLTTSPVPTTIEPCSASTCSGQAFSTTNPDMIDMGSLGSSTVCAGSPPPDCRAIVIEHLALNGNNQSGVNGIVNLAAQELSRVDDVVLTNMGAPSGAGTGIGLYVNGYTSNSGPYSNIYYSGSGICADLDNSTGGGPHDTRGIHGLTCVMSGSETTPAVYVDSANNTLEDVYISGNSNQDGILIGANSIARNTVLFNVYGSGLANVVYISSAQNSTDMTIMGVTTTSGNSIYDELTSTQLSDSNVGMYIVGEAVGGGMSRFTTSFNVPTWLVGSSSPSGNCATGSFYSETSGSDTLWGCKGPTGGGSVGTWQDIN